LEGAFDCVASIKGIEHTENSFRITGSHDNPSGPIRSDLPNLYDNVFKERYAGKPDAEQYRKIFERYLSKEVMCGEYNVVVARKH